MMGWVITDICHESGSLEWYDEWTGECLYEHRPFHRSPIAWSILDRFTKEEIEMLNSPVVPDGRFGLSSAGLAPGLALIFNDALYERCKDLSRIMASARGFSPPHLLGQPEACFAVVSMAITWRLTPQLVASCTFVTPDGKVGYEGKLIQAILENSGQLEGGVTYEAIGEWSRIAGRFSIETRDKKQVPIQSWKGEDEEGLGVIVRATVKGETAPRELPVLLNEMWPRNSTMWITRPLQKLKYNAVRAFAASAMPGVLMGVPFADDETEMIDITPAVASPLAEAVKSGTGAAPATAEKPEA